MSTVSLSTELSPAATSSLATTSWASKNGCRVRRRTVRRRARAESYGYARRSAVGPPVGGDEVEFGTEAVQELILGGRRTRT